MCVNYKMAITIYRRWSMCTINHGAMRCPFMVPPPSPTLTITLTFINNNHIDLHQQQSHWPSSITITLTFINNNHIDLHQQQSHWPSSITITLTFINNNHIDLHQQQSHWPSSTTITLTFIIDNNFRFSACTGSLRWRPPSAERLGVSLLSDQRL